MEPEMNCFDMSGIELVKKKYYNAAKVDELMAEAKSHYEQSLRENAELKARLEELSAQKTQISDTLMSAQSIARQMVDDARVQAEETAKLAQIQAEETVKAAEKKAELILSGARSKKEAAEADVSEVQEYALRCVETCVDKLRQQHMDAIEMINAQWQDFLSGLILPEDGGCASQTAEAQPVQEKTTDWMAVADMELPEMEINYDDIDADTFFSGAFFSEQSGIGIFEQLKSVMDSIEHKTEE